MAFYRLARDFLFNGTGSGWQRWTVQLPPAALNRDIVIEVTFESDVFNPDVQGGLYIDDVAIR